MTRSDCLHTTPMPAEQDEAEHIHGGYTGRDAAITAMLTAQAGAAPADPIFAAIAAACEAERWANGDIPGEEAPAGTPEEQAEAEERHGRTMLADKAHRVVFGIRPTTSAGFMALLDFATEQQEVWQGWDDGPDVLVALRDSAALLAGHVREPVEPDPVFAVLEHFRVMRAECDASPNRGAKFRTPENEAREAETASLAEAEDDAWSDLVNTQPTSLPGLHAMIRFMGAEYERFSDVMEQADVFGTIGETVAALMGPGTTIEPDPIFAEIEECERLRARQAAFHAVCGSKPDSDPSWAGHRAAHDASWAQWNDMVLKTVPETAEGCRALAAYAGSWFKYQGVCEGEDGPVILDLIARSPMLGSGVRSFAAAGASTETANADAVLLDLGRRLDAAQASWRAAVEAAAEPSARRHAAMEAAVARGNSTMEDAREAETVPGYAEAAKAEDSAFEAIVPLAEAIGKLPTHTVAGLAVRARATLFMAWPGGTFPELVEDENEADSLDVFRLIEACCAAASVNWRGEPVGEGAADTVEGNGSIDLTDPHGLTSAIIDGWAAWISDQDAVEAAYENGTLVDEDDDEERPTDKRRHDLLKAAEALPTTRESLLPKALALAWIDYVGEWMRGWKRDDYATNGRLVLDICEVVRTRGPGAAALVEA